MSKLLTGTQMKYDYRYSFILHVLVLCSVLLTSCSRDNSSDEFAFTTNNIETLTTITSISFEHRKDIIIESQTEFNLETTAIEDYQNGIKDHFLIRYAADHTIRYKGRHILHPSHIQIYVIVDPDLEIPLRGGATVDTHLQFESIEILAAQTDGYSFRCGDAILEDTGFDFRGIDPDGYSSCSISFLIDDYRYIISAGFDGEFFSAEDLDFTIETLIENHLAIVER